MLPTNLQNISIIKRNNGLLRLHFFKFYQWTTGNITVDKSIKNIHPAVGLSLSKE